MTLLRDDDSDIDALLVTAASGGYVPAPAPVLAEAPPRAPAPARTRKPRARAEHKPVATPGTATSDPALVAELSRQLAAQLASAPVPARASSAPTARPGEASLDRALFLSEDPIEARRLALEPEDYHRLPGLSSSTAKTLIARSPAHAWQEHAALGGCGRAPTPAMDRGSVVHAIALGKGARYVAVVADSWRTAAAKEARDAARADGAVPLLAADLEAAHETAARVTAALAARGIALTGESEVAVEWGEPSARGFVRCRAMFDHLLIDRGTIIDLKITADASPMAVERTAENLGYAIQEAAYLRALAALRPQLAGRARFLFAFVEPEPPYAVNVCRGDGAFRELGGARWQHAVAAWAECVHGNEWPAYGAGVNTVTAPPWVLKREGLAL